MRSLDSLTFIALENSQNGEVSSETVFHYSEKKSIISASYSGGKIIQGSILGKRISDTEIEFNYQHITDDLSLKAGHCQSTISEENNRLILNEVWQWFTDDKSHGASKLIEKV